MPNSNGQRQTQTTTQQQKLDKQKDKNKEKTNKQTREIHEAAEREAKHQSNVLIAHHLIWPELFCFFQLSVALSPSVLPVFCPLTHSTSHQHLFGSWTQAGENGTVQNYMYQLSNISTKRKKESQQQATTSNVQSTPVHRQTKTQQQQQREKPIPAQQPS